MSIGKAKQLVQPKLTINTPGDQYEQEADAMADRVIHMSSNEMAKPVTGLIGRSLQRKCEHCEEEEKKKKPVMRKAETGSSGMSVSSSFDNSLNASKGGGSPLPKGTRSFMENAFSIDFSSVKIHNGSQASEMSKGINAKAFTTGNDIYFKSGEYSPNSEEGKKLLAHELTHVVQQSGEGDQVQRIVADKEIQDPIVQQEPDICEGWEKDLQSLTIDAARFHFRTEHGQDIQINSLDCVSGTSVRIKVCYLTLADGSKVTVRYNPERNIIMIQHDISGVLRSCRYSYTCSVSGPVTYTKLNCDG
jgi:Domain of unknown function (DUF4157)